MPAFPLTDAQITDIAAFLHAQALVALHSNKVPGDYPVEKLRTGNAAAGKAYFQRRRRLQQVPLGDGRSRRCSPSRYDPIMLQSRILYPSGAKMTATVTLPSGQKGGRSAVVAHDEFTDRAARCEPAGIALMTC